MARSHGVLKTTVWDVGSDFRSLTVSAQWCYAMLISQPEINNCGVLPYKPEKWVRLANGLTLHSLTVALDELEQARFVVVDVTTGELLVRTFIKHDKVWSQPKLVTNARKLIRAIESDQIRDYLSSRHPWLIEQWDRRRIETFETDRAQAPEPVDEPGEETPTETGIPGKGYPSRARPGAGAGVGAGVGASSTVSGDSAVAVSAAAENGHAPQADTAAAAFDDQDEHLAAHADSVELEQLLDDLAIPASLREQARTDPARALACARYTIEQHGNGGYFRTVYESGDTPVLAAESRVRARVPSLRFAVAVRALVAGGADRERVRGWLADQTDDEEAIEAHLELVSGTEAA